MILTKKRYIEYLANTKVLLDNTNIDNEKLIELKKNIENIELIVPVVGGFSAGKSTLINSFLESEILPTDLTPETALATELRYSREDYIEAIKIDGSVDRYDITQSKAIKDNAKQYIYLRLFLNNENLKRIYPLVLVDMPGFDSPLELHNQAILNYLNRGIYFIVLTSIEDGNITKSMIRELDNITEFGKDFSFCLSKTNLRGQSDIDRVKEKIQEQLEDYFDFDKNVIPVADNSGKELQKILTDINVEKLFESIFIDDLKFNYMQIENSLNTIIATLKISNDDINSAILELQESINKITSKKEKMIQNARSKYSDGNIDFIIESVSKELRSQKDTLITMALSNNDTFSREINDIVKNTLIYEVKTRIKEASSDIVDDFSIELRDVASNLDNFKLDDRWVETIANSTKDLLTKAQNGLNTLFEDRKKSGKNTDTSYKTITAIIGLTTTIISPILELLIVFLPDIISFFTGKSQEAKQREEISNKLLNEIIPSIKSKIRGILPNIFNEQINTIIESISNEFEAQIKQKENEIMKTQEERENSIRDAEEEIGKLENIKQEVKSLATQNLYKESK